MKYFGSFLFCIIFVLVVVVNCVPVPQEIAIENENPKIICRQEMRKGYCRALIPRWVYDPKKGTCHEFKYGGCGGNGNNFRTRKDCESFCHGVTL